MAPTRQTPRRSAHPTKRGAGQPIRANETKKTEKKTFVVPATPPTTPPTATAITTTQKTDVSAPIPTTTATTTITTTTHQTDLLSPSVGSGAFAPCDPPTGRACVECWRGAFKAGGIFSSSCQSRTTRWSGFLWPQEEPVARAWLLAATLTLAECEAQELVSTLSL
jgi:hypothetical protein